MGNARKIVGSNVCPVPVTENPHTTSSHNAFRSNAFSGRLLAGLVGATALLTVSSSGCAYSFSNPPSVSQALSPAEKERHERKEEREKKQTICAIVAVSGAVVGGGTAYALVYPADDKDMKPEGKVAFSIGAAIVTGVMAAAVLCDLSSLESCDDGGCSTPYRWMSQPPQPNPGNSGDPRNIWRP